MRAIWICSYKSTAVERGCRTNTIGNGRGGSDDEWSAHTIALRPDLLRLIDLLLRIKKCDVCSRILLCGACSIYRTHQRRKLRSVCLILKIKRRDVRKNRGFGHSIK